MDTLTKQEELHRLFDYKDGNLYWKVNRRSNIMIGKKAGSMLGNKYWHIRINKKAIYTHRAIFLYHHGYLPVTIDHIDGNPSNNNIENLRAATQAQNSRNIKVKQNKHGIPGITLLQGKYWMPQLTVDGVKLYLGIFKDAEDAKIAYQSAVDKYCGEFRRRV